MRRRSSVVLAAGLGLAALASVSWGQEKVEQPKKAPSNKDLYLEQAENKPTSKPTVKFWVERAAGGDDERGRRDIVLDDVKAFHSGDRVWFKFVANVDCWAYLVNKGSSGRVTMLFPGSAGRENHVRARKAMTMPSENGPFRFDDRPGKERLCLVISPKAIPSYEQIAEEARSSGRSIELTSEQEKIWEGDMKNAAVMGTTKDLTLEQDAHPSDSEGPGNYLTDHGSGGFKRPITVYMTLRHEQ